ncbi:uncharacterized protein LOC118201650 [Stegodyphus dumicola]|uniref:uncharacterized protein LOC118201650 n=1 Tax=Stegodyphus dumicola TaxID=202533 RepID=UPI0015B2427F|nr:uncharacterized protein LOC118201650 [Stegodyphus dumicola]
MDFFEIKSGVDILQSFESDLLEFYHQVLSKEFDLSNKCNVLTFKRALGQILHSVHNHSALVYNTPAKKAAYLFWRSPMISSIAGRHLLQLFKHNPRKIDQAFLRGELKVCCLGGGPGTDVVAVSKIVTVLHHFFWFHNRQQLKLKFTIIDSEENWKITAKNVVEVLEQNPEFFDAEKMSLSFQFLKADLTQPLKDDSLFEICQADILTMFYFSSSLGENITKPAQHQLIQKLFDNMKTGALLFYIDVALCRHYRAMSVSANMFQNLSEVYGPFEHKLHLLPLDAIKKHIHLYSKDLGYKMCLYSSISTVSAWYKESSPPPNLTSVMEKIDLVRKMRIGKCQDKNRSGMNVSQKKIEKREKQAMQMRLSLERRLAKQAKIRERERNISLNSSKLKAFNSQVQRLISDRVDSDDSEAEEQKHFEGSRVDGEDAAFFLTKPKAKRIF